MGFLLLAGLLGACGLATAVVVLRRRELAGMHRSLVRRAEVDAAGLGQARLQFPRIDLSRCLGCATCVAVCPEDGVLDLVHGQAMVVNPARCVGVAACERECPVGAIAVTLGDTGARDDVPALTDELEAVGTEGLFLAGEVTAHALVKTAIEHGTRVAAAVARRARSAPADPDELDLCIVGAGPAGLACALEARRRGLRLVVLEQERALGGSVAQYPRHKLVLSEPVELPLFGRLRRDSYTKEELIALWRKVAREHALPIEHGQVFTSVERSGAGFVVHTRAATHRARQVCLAIGRRGVPQRLGVPGEDLPNVAYALLDAHGHRDRRILVVGGGDTAVETALALAEQPGNRVALSYRGRGFLRVRARNAERLAAARDDGRVAVLEQSRVVAIHPDRVELATATGATTVPSDDVFVMAGGVPALDLLRQSGVSFDPALRASPAPEPERASGLAASLLAATVLLLGALGFALWHFDYYRLPLAERPAHVEHALLRPGRGLGLWFGIAAALLVAANLLYLLRRTGRFGLRLGSLRLWMTGHVATGILACVCALLHAALSPRDTPGGHAFWALVVLCATGAIGRWFYALVPRAANGRELELREAKAELARDVEVASGGFAARARAAVDELVEARQWRSTFFGRLRGLWRGQRDLQRLCGRLRVEAARAGVSAAELRRTLGLVRRTHRAALSAGHLEDLRAVLATWRWLHRWVALVLVLLLCVHVFYALAFGSSLLERVRE